MKLLRAAVFAPSLAALCFSVVATATMTVGLEAQVVRGGDLVVGNFGSPWVFRVEPSGTVTALPDGGLLSGASGVAVTRGRDVLVCDFRSNSLVRIDNAGNASTVAGSLAGPLRVAEGHDGDYAVTSSSSGSLLRVTPAGVVSTIASGAPLVRPFDVGIDGNGDYLVVDDRARGLFRVTAAGAVTPIHVGAPFRLPQGVAVFPNGDFAVFDGLTDSVFRVDRATGTVTTHVSSTALGGNPCGIVEAFDGGFFVSQSAASGNAVVAIDAAANVTTVASGAPFTNLEDIARVPFLSGPTALTTGPGSTYSFVLDVPAEPNTLYTLTLSASVYPGFPLGGGDPRSLTINPDALFFATVLQNVPPILVNWTAATNPSGLATATLDLQTLAPGTLSGTTLQLQGFMLGVTQIGTLTNVIPLAFQ